MKKTLFILAILILVLICCVDLSNAKKVVAKDDNKQKDKKEKDVKKPDEKKEKKDKKGKKEKKEEKPVEKIQLTDEEKAAEEKKRVEKQVLNELAKAQAATLKEEQKQTKIQQKLLKAEEKIKQKEADAALKLEQQKLKEEVKQAQLAAAAAKLCQIGTHETTDGECKPCSENCENCGSAELCNYCEKGFYRVVSDKKAAAYCASSIPKGYLPQISKFYKQNPTVVRTAKSYEGTAIAQNGKKVITAEPVQLPFTLNNGVPEVNGEKVRLDVVPCLTQCAECPSGFLTNPETKGCFTAAQCVWPRQVVGDECQSDDSTVLKGNVLVEKKQQKVNQKFPSQQWVSLTAQINRQDIIGITYQWNAFNDLSEDISAKTFPPGVFGKKIKANITDLAAGSILTFKVTIKDSKVVDDAGIVVETQFTNN